ncbi:hypothetical protein KPB04_12195 [Burkholderia cenocepacia]|uniref:hypothetical protein n=1 Tax=Burkholderia cenocepacia TaxID=95486 RepID=UPI0028670BBB|nr:hypothetical protein [Burkholderia cenocepacia]MDR8102489.1 hypothetical protein [Burkholderia cenocepacia]
MTTDKSRADALTYLLPCAFCGCTKCPVRQGNGIGDYWLECSDCGASTRLREDGAGCEKDWNRRPVEQHEAAPADERPCIVRDDCKWPACRLDCIIDSRDQKAREGKSIAELAAPEPPAADERAALAEIPAGWMLVKREHIDEIEARMNPDLVEDYRGCGLYDDDATRNNFIACNSALEDIRTSVESIRADFAPVFLEARASSPNAAELERALSETIDERDQMEEAGTRLANAVGEFLGVDVGEWSSASDPILTAIEALRDRVWSPNAAVEGAREHLFAAACECLSPEQMDKFDALFDGDDDTCARFLRCVIKRTPAPAAEPVGWLTEDRIAEIARKCEIECQAWPGATLWMCAEMAIKETIEALSGTYHLAEVCEDADGFKHIEQAVEAIDDIPAGTKLYAAPPPPAPASLLARQEIAEAWRQGGSEAVEIALRRAAPASAPVGLTEEQITEVWNSMPGGYDGFLKSWGYIQFARRIEDLLKGDKQ